MKQKDIYWANLAPAKGHEQDGKRPVVILSGNALNDKMGLFIVCPLSSKIKQYPGCVPLKKDKSNNLSGDSEILTFQIRTISKNRLGKKIGKITDGQLALVFQGLFDTFTY